MKIVLIGPFPPYRGGISLFNHSLADELDKDHDVHRITFSLQYPKVMFPGKSQYSEFKGKLSSRLINSINPTSWIKTSNFINKLSPDLIIFQYWMPFFVPAFNSIAKRVRKGCGAKIMVNCNNIKPHEPKPLDNMMTKTFFNNCDYFMVMCSEVEADLISIIENPKYRKVPHPLYDIFGKKPSKVEARKELKLEAEKIILNFGLVRDYKGLDILIESAKRIKDKIDNFKILVVGECYGNEKKFIDLAQKHNVLDYFDFRFKFIPNHMVSYYFSACDLVVLPYRTATQSGVVPIAYHFDKPVIVSNVGGLPEVVDEGQSGFICEPRPDSLSKTIINFFDKDLNQFTDFISNYKNNFSWSNFAKNIVGLSKE